MLNKRELVSEDFEQNGKKVFLQVKLFECTSWNAEEQCGQVAINQTVEISSNTF